MGIIKSDTPSCEARAYLTIFGEAVVHKTRNSDTPSCQSTCLLNDFRRSGRTSNPSCNIQSCQARAHLTTHASTEK